MSVPHDKCDHEPGFDLGDRKHHTTYGKVCCYCYEQWVRDHHRVPQVILDGIKRWVDDGIQPGGFLTSVLRNDKMSIVACLADEINALNIVKIYRYLINKCPHECWGSEAKMIAWRKKKMEQRNNERKEV